MRNKIVAGTIGLLAMSTVMAQSSLNRSKEAEAIAVITEVGGTCEDVIRNQTIVTLTDNTLLMAVACSGGDAERYVLVVDSRGDFTWYSTCEALQAANNNEIGCFR